MLSPPWFPLPKLLLAFLLAQMLLINFVFNFFFLLVFFLLLQDFLSARQRFVSLQPGSRVFFSALLIFSLVTLYLFPYLANRSLDAAAGEKNVSLRFSLLQRAAWLSPLDVRPPLAQADVLRFYAAGSRKHRCLERRLDGPAPAQKLNRDSVEALIAESALFQDFLGKQVRYPALGEEILAPLRRAEKLAPFNPFLKMRQAAVLWEFGRKAEARLLAQAALDLEPEYAAAIVFIHELDGLPADDPALQKQIARIRDKASRLRARPGSYLARLHQVPVAASGQ